MSGGTVKLTVGLFLTSVLVALTTAKSQGYFTGGTMNFYCVDASNPNSYRFHFTVITSWVLGHGPCGAGCSVTDVGKQTRARRDQAIQATGDSNVFGNWTLEVETPRNFGGTIEIQEITDEVNSNIHGRISAVSPKLMWEQDIEEFEMDIIPTCIYTDVAMEGYAWKPYDLNLPKIVSVSAAHRMYHLQSKVHPKRRNDTGMPNSSPIALNQPIYKIELNKVTQIHLTPFDKDGDFIKCRMGRFVEIENIGSMRNTSISQDCIVTITAMESDGFSDDSWGVVGVVLEDFNRHPIQRGDETLPAYATRALSAISLDFMVWVVANMTVPEFVSPTPDSQHVFTVYAGSSLVIPLAAKPSDKSMSSTEIVEFRVLSLPDHLFNNSAPQKDPNRLADRVMTSNLEWRTDDGDAGNFVIQVVAIDNEGFESMDRSYAINVNVLPQDLGQNIDRNPYFPFFPQAGSVTCQLHTTCSVPIFASPGMSGHVIRSVQIVDACGLHVMAGPVESVHYRHVHTYRTDVHFTASDVGDKTVCFLAIDDHGFFAKKCTKVTLIPPNYCDAQPCHAGATCVSGLDGFQCHCPADRNGSLCETWINPCTSSAPPCLHGGRCISSRERYACDCSGTGFTGKFCETDYCHPQPCHAGATCVSGLDGFQCHCPPHRNGTLCETWMDPCKSSTPYCLHGGKCLSVGEYYACDCHETGFTGEVCEKAHGAGHHTPEATPDPMIG